MYDIPESLIHRSVRRESNYNPGAHHGPYWGLMQIRHDTARSMGYHGSAQGLLDADTNLTYAVPYLANAYKLSGGSEARAIQLYAGGYYYEAKRRHMLGELYKTAQEP
jgi:soluble lytic murein transglycosylase-like protein